MKNPGVQNGDGRESVPPGDRVIPVSIGSVARQSSDGSGIDQKSTSSGRCPSAAAQAYSDSMGSNAPISCFRDVADGPSRSDLVVKKKENPVFRLSYLFHKGRHQL